MVSSAPGFLSERHTVYYQEFKCVADIKSQSRKEYTFLLLLIPVRIPFCRCLFSFLTQKARYQHAVDAEVWAESMF